MYFEWDEAKRVINLTKHGIDFARAADFFAGDGVRIISMRRANAKERQAYEAAQRTTRDED